MLLKISISFFDRAENIVEKRRKCWLPAFSSFPTMFSKALCFKVAKSLDCVVKSLPTVFLLSAATFALPCVTDGIKSVGFSIR